MRQTNNKLQSQAGLTPIDFTQPNDGTPQVAPVDGDYLRVEVVHGRGAQLVILDSGDVPSDQIGMPLKKNIPQAITYRADKAYYLKSSLGVVHVHLMWGR